jgi:hypothetical protein
MEIRMPTKDFDASSPNADSSASKSAPKPNAAPAPSMLWMLLPVALLLVLAFLSR